MLVTASKPTHGDPRQANSSNVDRANSHLGSHSRGQTQGRHVDFTRQQANRNQIAYYFLKRLMILPGKHHLYKAEG